MFPQLWQNYDGDPNLHDGLVRLFSWRKSKSLSSDDEVVAIETRFCSCYSNGTRIWLRWSGYFKTVVMTMDDLESRPLHECVAVTEREVKFYYCSSLNSVFLQLIVLSKTEKSPLQLLKLMNQKHNKNRTSEF